MLALNLDKSAIVLDIGSRYVKCGLSEEKAPRVIIKWNVAQLMASPKQLTRAEWYAFLQPKLHEICYDLLHVNPTQRRLVLCEDLLFPRVFRETLVQTAFEALNVSSVLLVPSIFMALYATINHTALIVDCGYAETRILPVYKGIPLQPYYTTTPLGSRSCCQFLKQQWDQQAQAAAAADALAAPTDCSASEQAAPDAKMFADFAFDEEEAEDILTRACFAQPLEPSRQLPTLDCSVETKDQKRLKIPGQLRTLALEQLFVATCDPIEPAMSIPESILKVLGTTPIDIRVALAQNLLCIGGTSMLPGFCARMQEQLVATLLHDGFHHQLTCLAKQQHMGLAPVFFPRNVMSWVGASVFAATERAKAIAVSAADYSENKTSAIHDWMAIPAVASN